MKKNTRSGLEIGKEVFFKPKGSKVYENRLILLRMDNNEYISLAPDGQMVCEDFLEKGSAHEVKDYDMQELPAKVAKGLVDCDEMPDQDEFDELIVRAEAMEIDIRIERQQGIDEDGGGRSSGSKRPFQGYNVTPKTSAADQGLKALGKKSLDTQRQSGGLSGGLGALAAALGKNDVDAAPIFDDEDTKDNHTDARTLPVLHDRQGQRFRDFRDAVSRCEGHSFIDWPVPGPCTVMWVLKWMVAKGGTPLTLHAAWKTNGRASPRFRVHCAPSRELLPNPRDISVL